MAFKDKYKKNKPEVDSEFQSEVIVTRRVAKVVKGGKKLRFTAMVVMGNKKDKIGIGLSKGLDPRSAIEKASAKAKKNMRTINIVEGTFPYEVFHKFKSSKIYFKPASSGTGLIASNSIRPILELSGIKDLYTKIYGTNNKITNAYCVVEALDSLSG